MTSEEKRNFNRQYQLRQGYTGTRIETRRNHLLIGLTLVITSVLTAFCFGWIGW